MNASASTITLALASLFVVSSAAAEPGQKSASTAAKTTTTSAVMPADSDRAADADARRGLTGLEIVLRPSFGGAGASSPVKYTGPTDPRSDPGAVSTGASPYGPGFVGQAMLGYRFHPLVSGGLRAGLRQASASATSDGATDLKRSSWDAGFYVRAYPLATTPSVAKHLDPWVGVGVGYMRDTQSYKRPLTGVAVDWTLDHHAVAVPLGIGVDYRVHPLVSLGPSFEYTLANSVAGCLKASAAGRLDVLLERVAGRQGRSSPTATAYWTAGLDLRATF
ncbi:MAG: outer membrane beta-barrel protein [Polyangiaceae bacterium]